MKRREFLVASLASLAAGRTMADDFDGIWKEVSGGQSAAAPQGRKAWAGKTGPKVFFTREISPAGLQRVYAALGVRLPGKVGAKVSTGEPGGRHFLDPQLVKGLVQALDANIVECNTAYGGRRGTLQDHIRTAVEHGWADIATVDIMDGIGTMTLPAPKGAVRLRQDLVGAHFHDYASFLVLSHFKGHAMGGFGGALKNLSIGFASRAGKLLIHSAGRTDARWLADDQDGFLEAMAEAAKAVCDARPGAMAYLNVMNHLSVDCDCDSHPAAPTMKDVGILGALDPVALDQACVDLVYAAPDGKALVERMESRNGLHTLAHAAALGLGSRAYQLVEV